MSETRPPVGVIFDMDGVLVDSADAHFESWRRVAAELGRTDVTRQQFEASFGRRSAEIIAEWFALADPAAAAAVDRRKEEIYREILSGGVPEMPGARQLVASLHRAGMRIAVGSSGPPENVSLVVHALGLMPMLRAIVTGRDVQRGKPDPQVFQVAAQRMVTELRHTVVVEDAPPGVLAARNANMPCIALASTHPAASLCEANRIVAQLADITPAAILELVGLDPAAQSGSDPVGP